MARVTAVGCVLLGAEGSCPPLPYLEVEDREAQALIDMNLAVAYSGPDAEVGGEPEGESEGESEGEPEGESEGEVDEEAAKRASAITEALLLMEAGDLAKSGDRKGKPKVEAIEAASGLTDVTIEEIDAAVAASEAA